MIEFVTTLMSKYSFNQIVVLLLAYVLIDVFYKLFVDKTDLYDQIHDQKKIRFAEIMQFVEDTLSRIEAIYMANIQKVSDSSTMPQHVKELHILNFSLALERTLFMHTKERIKLYLHYNGFYSLKTGSAELEGYIEAKGKQIQSITTNAINAKLHPESPFKIVNDNIFSPDQAIAHMRDIVVKAKQIKQNEDDSIHDMKKSRWLHIRLWNSIKIIFGK